MDAPERYEQLIAFLESNLPAPVDRQETADGSVQFIGGEPAEVVVSLTETSVLVSEFSGVWESPFTFAARPRRVGVLKWRRLPETALFNALTVLIKGAARCGCRGFRCAAIAAAALRPSGCTMTACARRARTSTAARFTDLDGRATHLPHPPDLPHPPYRHTCLRARFKIRCSAGLLGLPAGRT